MIFWSQHGSELSTLLMLDRLCNAWGSLERFDCTSRYRTLVDAGLVEPMNNQRRGVRLIQEEDHTALPVLGYIAAGHPIEAIEQRRNHPGTGTAGTARPVMFCRSRDFNDRGWDPR